MELKIIDRFTGESLHCLDDVGNQWSYYYGHFR